MRQLALCLFLLLLGHFHAQVAITGTVVQENGESLPGATVRVLSKDSAFITGGVTDENGVFTITVTANAKYNLLFSYFSYRGQGRMQPVNVRDESISVGKIELKESGTLKEVVVAATQTRGEQKGDTTQFNASAYKTHPDASAEDLVKKLPGVTTDNNGVKVNGENVQKVLVDGKPFFGEDPNAALKNLPADMIDKIEVFDRMSDQSQFTRFNDGEQQKTINLVTKKDRNKGIFGKAYAGAGADEQPVARYHSGMALNSFNGKRRVTATLMSNNVNQQNFSIADISGSQGSQGGRPRFNNPANGVTPGNSITHSGGINYSDEWSKDFMITTSYFGNNTSNTNRSDIVRKYFTENAFTYSQNSEDRSDNLNHRANVRAEWTADSSNKIILTPSINYQDNRSSGTLSAFNTTEDLVRLGSTRTASGSDVYAYDFSNSALFQHRFAKRGRTISLNLFTLLSERNNAGSYAAENYGADNTFASLDQVFNTYSYTKRGSLNLAYTEPLSEFSHLQLSYSPSYSEAKSDKTTRDFSAATSDYASFNPALSNKYENRYTMHRGGIGWRYSRQKTNLELNVEAQEAMLNSMQTFPNSVAFNQSFFNILPGAQFSHRFSRSRNFRAWYRSSTSIPSTTQLQNVADISNPIQVKAGNPALRQTAEQSMSARYGSFNSETSRNFMAFVNVGTMLDYISNGTYILGKDSVIQGVGVKKGSQLTIPVNLSGYYSARSFVTYGFPVKAIKSNLSLSGGFSYSRIPSLINSVLNHSGNYAPSFGLNIGSNISRDIDFSLGYNSTYTMVKNTVQRQSDNNFFTHTATARINWTLLKSVVIATDASHITYAGLTQSFNQNYLLWNGSIGYKFLKDRSLELKVTVYDILKKNRTISRTVNSAYTEDTRTDVLRRYALLTLSYTLKSFKGSAPEEAVYPGQEGRRDRHR
jgi:hypothetical protein